MWLKRSEFLRRSFFLIHSPPTPLLPHFFGNLCLLLSSILAAFILHPFYQSRKSHNRNAQLMVEKLLTFMLSCLILMLCDVGQEVLYVINKEVRKIRMLCSLTEIRYEADFNSFLIEGQ